MNIPVRISRGDAGKQRGFRAGRRAAVVAEKRRIVRAGQSEVERRGIGSRSGSGGDRERHRDTRCSRACRGGAAVNVRSRRGSRETRINQVQRQCVGAVVNDCRSRTGAGRRVGRGFARAVQADRLSDNRAERGLCHAQSCGEQKCRLFHFPSWLRCEFSPKTMSFQ